MKNNLEVSVNPEQSNHFQQSIAVEGGDRMCYQF